jgi:spermidine synthase
MTGQFNRIWEGLRGALTSLVMALAVFSTGAVALVYQVVFTRYLSRFVGSDHVAAGLTLGVFLAGLALGAALFGRLSTVVRRHLAVYSVLEAAVGAWALAFPTLAAWIGNGVAGWSFDRPWMLLVEGLAVAVALVLPPTMIMGGTVPFLTRALARRPEELSSLHAGLYGANTAGAFAGVLLAGFWLVPRFGLPLTLRGCAAVNLAVAAWFGLLALRSATPRDLAGLRTRSVPATPRFGIRTIYAVALLNGFAVLLLETSLLRFGALVLGGSAYSFALVVAAFVLALAAGSFAVSRLAVLRDGLLWACQLAAGAWLLVLYAGLDAVPYYAHLLRIGFQAGASGFLLFHAAAFAGLLLLLAVPVGLLGTTLPLLYHELGAGVRDAGRLSGRLLAWNGLGTLLGAVAGSFALYDLVDLPRGYLLAVAVVFGNALLAARAAEQMPRALAAAALALSIAVLVSQPAYDGDRLVAGVYRMRAPLAFSWLGPRTFFTQRLAGSSVVARDDDAVASVAVLEHAARGPADPTSRSLVVNGRSESNTVADAATLRLAAHIPALWAGSRDRVLVIGLGTGVTVGSLALYNDVRQLDVAEISPAAIRFLPLFAEFTGAVDRDPRLRILPGDATLVVRRACEPWDLIVSEPSNPWTSGADSLFTREFYRQVGDRLTPDGLFLQWVQLYESDFEILGMILNTLREEFPVVHAFRGSPGDLLLLASRRPFTSADRERAEQVLQRQPRVAASLAGIGVGSVREILQREVQTLPVVMQQARGFGVHTADHPRLLYLAGKAMFSGSEVPDEALRHGTTRIEPLLE